MKLSLFLTDLLQSGNVTVPRAMQGFEQAELDEATLLLLSFYQADSLNIPFTAPAFDAKAAVWAAQYIFHVIQLILLRDVNESEIGVYLEDFEGEHTPEAIYSADLTLRYLPDLFHLSSGLSPADPLVSHLQSFAAKWPFSSVGIDQINIAKQRMLFENAALQQAYIDRIIGKKDINRLKEPKEKELLKAALGLHGAVLWPEFALL